MKHFHSIAPLLTAVIALSACSGASQGLPLSWHGTAGTASQSAMKRDTAGCTEIKDSTGARYTVAQVGGGYWSDVEYSRTPCQIGVYINGSSSFTQLWWVAVNGPFSIGIYFDNAGKQAQLDYGSICVHGSTSNYDGCVTGINGRSPGTGLFIRNTPSISESYTEIDSYTAGFVTYPCPNKADRLSVDYTTMTNTVYPWAYAGGKESFNFDSPKPKKDCKGTQVGAGVPHN
jgi:hypothetical protein